MSEHSRSNATFKNYAISLGVIVGIVLVLAFVVATRSGEHIPSVDYQPDADALRDSADYPVTVPSEELLREGWTPTSSTLEVAESGPAAWSVGFATAEDSHVMFTQSDADPDAVVAEETRGAEEAGTVSVGGSEWEHYDSEDWDALVRREEGVTLVVAGPADMDELTRVAEALETDPADGGAEPREGAESGGEAGSA
ncbi:MULTISPECIES: DUF4245 domain-containing protein [Nocardiopsis]|uniref:DUF4245 domain-containing protein n=1 Tax=Nocardiopsis sinuspersici TaxID=501010 RepID=A0A1V3BW82_9ACTN|nr:MULTISPECIES: DUF4245 domain-containing protein [Nocardiopsis]OOC52509.1 hypothetical protein NOSIN_00545 [Nocardiopsis sinuspersici]